MDRDIEYLYVPCEQWLNERGEIRPQINIRSLDDGYLKVVHHHIYHTYYYYY